MDYSSYRPLDPLTNEIRLLTLLPRDKTGRICCTLQHVSLINPPDYVALSYSWGDTSFTKEVVINGVSANVGSNLESALRHLSNRYACLWIDAICIHQRDNDEKSKQLLWMASVYRRAKEVVAWTGETADDSDLALDFVENFSHYSTDVENPTLSDQAGKALTAFQKFLERPYWRRVWVIQELALARDTIAYCGQRHVSWSLLASVVENCSSQQISLSFKSFKSLTATPSFANLMNLCQFNVDARQNKPLSLLEALRRSVRSQSTEARDKVFALLGLVYDYALYLPVPNYSQSARDICIGMAISGISSTRSLDIALFLGCGCNTTVNLPSWTPNWFGLDESSTLRQTRYLLYPEKQSGLSSGQAKIYKFKTTANTSATIHVTNDILQTLGFYFDEIENLSQLSSETGRHQSMSEIPSHMPKFNPYKSDYAHTEAMVKSLLQNDDLGPFYKEVYLGPVPVSLFRGVSRGGLAWRLAPPYRDPVSPDPAATQ